MAATVRVLVVDDCEDCADITSSLLRILGFDTQVAYDGETAVKLVRCFHPDAVLLDLGMPVMNGFEVSRRIRRATSSELVLVAYTGYPHFRHRALDAGFDDYILKPVGLERLKEALRKIQGQRVEYELEPSGGNGEAPGSKPVKSSTG